MTRLALLFALACALAGAFLFAAAPALAAKHEKPVGTIEVVSIADVDADGAISYGDFVGFAVTTTAPVSYVEGSCSQGGSVVGIFGWLAHTASSYTSEKVGLYSPIWPSGGAECTADLHAYDGKRDPILATTVFEVSP